MIEGQWAEEPTYCTPEDVAMTMGLPDPYDNQGMYSFSDMSVPTYDYVKQLILGAEDTIDLRTRRTWRENREEEHIVDLSGYWQDINGLRISYWEHGGETIQLRKDIMPWDPEKGDKLEIRTRSGAWRDITDLLVEDEDEKDENTNLTWAWFDRKRGRLFLRTYLFQVRPNALRISYRSGSTGKPPVGINRLCSLIVASQVMNMQSFNIKIGMGGDISGIKDQQLKAWAEEINNLYASFQRSSSVHSLLG